MCGNSHWIETKYWKVSNKNQKWAKTTHLETVWNGPWRSSWHYKQLFKTKTKQKILSVTFWNGPWRSSWHYKQLFKTNITGRCVRILTGLKQNIEKFLTKVVNQRLREGTFPNVRLEAEFLRNHKSLHQYESRRHALRNKFGKPKYVLFWESINSSIFTFKSKTSSANLWLPYPIGNTLL